MKHLVTISILHDISVDPQIARSKGIYKHPNRHLHATLPKQTLDVTCTVISKVALGTPLQRSAGSCID